MDLVKKYHVAERFAVGPAKIIGREETFQLLWFGKPVVIVKHNAGLLCALQGPPDNLLLQVCRDHAIRNFVPQKDLISGLDHLQDVLSSDLCFHQTSGDWCC